MANQSYYGHNRNARCLGAGYSTWTIDDLRVILNHYGRPAGQNMSKNRLMRRVNDLALDYRLTHSDRVDILWAWRRGYPLPYRKPRVRFPRNQTYTDHHIATMPVQNNLQHDTSNTAIFRPELGSNGHATILDIMLPAQTAFPDSGAISSTSSPTCSICDNTLTPNERSQPPLSACNHKADVCRICFSTHIRTQMATRMWDRLSCPECNQHLVHYDIQTHADRETFQRYVVVVSCLLFILTF